MHRRRLLQLSLLAGVAVLAGGCGGSTAPGLQLGAAAPQGRDVLSVARANGLSSFARAIETTGLTEELSGTGPYTLFAPTDAAFRSAGISPGRDSEELRALLAYHVVPGHVGSAFMTGMEMNHLTSTGDTLSVNGRSGGIRVNDANLVRADLPASNGIVHIVDRLLRGS